MTDEVLCLDREQNANCLPSVENFRRESRSVPSAYNPRTVTLSIADRLEVNEPGPGLILSWQNLRLSACKMIW